MGVSRNPKTLLEVLHHFLTYLGLVDAMESGEECSAEEWNTIETKLAYTVRRNVRRRTQRIVSLEYACKSLCSNFAPFHCSLCWPACTKAYYYPIRRELHEEGDSGDYSRESKWSWSKMSPDELSCSQQTMAIHWTLNALVQEVSDPCQAVLKAPRQLTCYNVDPQPAVTTGAKSSHSELIEGPIFSMT